MALVTKRNIHMHFYDLLKTKNTCIFCIYWTFKYPVKLKKIFSMAFELIDFKASATATFKLALIKDWNLSAFSTSFSIPKQFSAGFRLWIIWPWNIHKTGHASPIHPGAACIKNHTNRLDRTSKEADESSFFSQ